MDLLRAHREAQRAHAAPRDGRAAAGCARATLLPHVDHRRAGHALGALLRRLRAPGVRLNTPPPLPRTNRTILVPPLVLIGHATSEDYHLASDV